MKSVDEFDSWDGRDNVLAPLALADVISYRITLVVSKPFPFSDETFLGQHGGPR